MDREAFINEAWHVLHDLVVEVEADKENKPLDELINEPLEKLFKHAKEVAIEAVKRVKLEKMEYTPCSCEIGLPTCCDAKDAKVHNEAIDDLEAVKQKVIEGL